MKLFLKVIAIYIISVILTLPIILIGWLSDFSLTLEVLMKEVIWFVPSMVVSLYMTLKIGSSKKALIRVLGIITFAYMVHLSFEMMKHSIYLYSTYGDVNFLSDPLGYLHFQFWKVSFIMESLSPYPWLSGGFLGYLIGLILRKWGLSYERGNYA